MTEAEFWGEEVWEKYGDFIVSHRESGYTAREIMESINEIEEMEEERNGVYKNMEGLWIMRTQTTREFL